MEIAILRLIHLGCGILWAGGAVLVGFFIVPAVGEAGPAGGAVMQGVVKRKMPLFLTGLGLLTVLSGARLYMIRFSMQWLYTAEGICLTLGGLLGTAALIVGITVSKPTVEKMGKLGAEIKAAGGPPTPEQAALMQALGARVGKAAKVVAWHVIVAVVLMAGLRFSQIVEISGEAPVPTSPATGTTQP